MYIAPRRRARARMHAGMPAKKERGRGGDDKDVLKSVQIDGLEFDVCSALKKFADENGADKGRRQGRGRGVAGRG